MTTVIHERARAMIEPNLSPDEPFRLDALRKLNQLDTPLEERFERLTRMAQRLLGVPVAAISLVDGDRQWYKSVQGSNITQTSRSISFCGHTILQDEPLHVPDAREDPRFHDNPLVTGDSKVVFYLGCPVHAQDGSKIGAFCAVDHQPHPISQEDMQTLLDLAAMVENELGRPCQAAADKEMIKEAIIRRRSEVDPLTRVWNRDAVFELLDIRIQHATASGTGVAVIMADVDGLQAINAHLGSAMGDDVLRQVAKRALGAARGVDSVGRYGGDEFAIVLSECAGLVEARSIAETVRERIGQSPISSDRGQADVSVSVGVVYCPDVSAVDDALMLREVNEAVDRARKQGGNRVEALMFDPKQQRLAA
jgi:diguanylate cyclase (GGDEF)-like protein